MPVQKIEVALLDDAMSVEEDTGKLAALHGEKAMLEAERELLTNSWSIPVDKKMDDDCDLAQQKASFPRINGKTRKVGNR